jgi:hypothetical protein
VYANDNPVSMADQDGRSSFFFTVTSLMQNWGAAALGVDLAFMSMLTGPSLIGKAVSFALAGAAVFSFAVAFGASPTAATWATVCAEFSVAAEIWWSQSLAAVNSASVAGGVARGVVEAALCYALVLTAACVMDDLDQ